MHPANVHPAIFPSTKRVQNVLYHLKSRLTTFNQEGPPFFPFLWIGIGSTVPIRK